MSSKTIINAPLHQVSNIYMLYVPPKRYLNWSLSLKAWTQCICFTFWTQHLHLYCLWKWEFVYSSIACHTLTGCKTETHKAFKIWKRLEPVNMSYELQDQGYDQSCKLLKTFLRHDHINLSDWRKQPKTLLASSSGYIGDDLVGFVCGWSDDVAPRHFVLPEWSTSMAAVCASFIMTDCLYKMLFRVTVILLLWGSRCRRAWSPAVSFYNVNVEFFYRHHCCFYSEIKNLSELIFTAVHNQFSVRNM